jgi:protein-disulfide isomerase
MQTFNQFSIFISIAIGAMFVVVAWQATSSRESVTTPTPIRSDAVYAYGSARAPITIVEWSDAECPFCARLHPTLKRLVDESDGQVQWHYRHLPLPNHRMAEPAAIAAECVGLHQGSDAFWDFLDAIFMQSDRLNEATLLSLVTNAGVTGVQYAACQESDDIAALIAEDVATVQYFGGSGTPFSLIVYPDRTIRPVRGALPYESWLPLIEQSS